MIIAITGVPGTGKTLAAKGLSQKLGWRLIDLNNFANEKGAICGFDKKRQCDIVDEALLNNEIHKINENLIIESHYSHEIENDLTVALRTSIKELRKRLSSRGWPKEKTEENIEAEIMGICSEEARELGRTVLEIDTTKKNPDDVVIEIIKHLNKNNSVIKQ